MMKTIGENAVAMRTEIRDKENELSSKDEQIERLQECISTMWEQALPGRVGVPASLCRCKPSRMSLIYA